MKPKNTEERRYCLFLNLFMLLRGGCTSPAKYKMESFVTIVTFVTINSILNVTGVLDPPMPTARRVEQNNVW